MKSPIHPLFPSHLILFSSLIKRFALNYYYYYFNVLAKKHKSDVKNIGDLLEYLFIFLYYICFYNSPHLRSTHVFYVVPNQAVHRHSVDLTLAIFHLQNMRIYILGKNCCAACNLFTGAWFLHIV